MLDQFFEEYEFGEFSPIDITANLLMALVLSLAVCFVYRRTHTGFSYSRSFNVTLVSVTMTITMIMMIIGNYWVLSLGLVGALSVIRFRSAIKDPKDIAYLFLCIAIGLACSTGNHVISVLGTLIIGATLYALHALRFGAAPNAGHTLTVSLNEAESSGDAFQSAAQAAGATLEFRSYARLNEHLGEYVYTVDLGETSEQAFIDRMRQQVSGVERLSLIAPETSVEM